MATKTASTTSGRRERSAGNSAKATPSARPKTSPVWSYEARGELAKARKHESAKLLAGFELVTVALMAFSGGTDDCEQTVVSGQILVPVGGFEDIEADIAEYILTKRQAVTKAERFDTELALVKISDGRRASRAAWHAARLRGTGTLTRSAK